VYDIVLLTHRGRIEGVNLQVPVEADAPPLRDKDQEEIRRLVMGKLRLTWPAGAGSGRSLMTRDVSGPAVAPQRWPSHFADRRRILFLAGRGSEARALVEEVTTRKTTLRSPVPFVVWRVEVWFYRKEFGAWDRYDSEVVTRQRPTVTDFQNTTWVFEPKLGGLTLTEEEPVAEVTYRLPTTFDRATGLVGPQSGGSE